MLVADPFPERGCAGDARVGDEVAVVDAAGVHTERAGEELAALLGELLEDLRQRWTAFAGDPDRDSGCREADRFLREEYRDLFPLVERGAANEEGDGHALGVFKAGCKVDDDLLSCHM